MEKILERYMKEDFVELIDNHIKSNLCSKLMLKFIGAERCDELVIAHNGGISALMVLRDEVTGEAVEDVGKFLDGLMEEVMNDEED